MLVSNNHVILTPENLETAAYELIRRERNALSRPTRDEAFTAMLAVQEVYLFLDMFLDQEMTLAILEHAHKIFDHNPYKDNHKIGYIIGRAK